MTKLLSSLRIATLAALSVGTLAGCEMYFGESEDNWDYCGADGYYSCAGDDCQWVSSTCPDGTQTGLPCAADEECAAGCYCDEGAGVCVEGGFCTQDSDCGDGLTCDEDRSSCEEPEGPTCTTDADCESGSVCQDGHCTATCVCGSDAEAQANGFGFCDEARSTCMPGEDPAGVCIADQATEITCNIKQPNCPEGTTALAKDGCYTGECRAISQCGLTVACEELQHHVDCSADAARCASIATGTNCTKPDGSLCQPGDSDCTCENFSFERCQTRSGAVPEN